MILDFPAECKVRWLTINTENGEFTITMKTNSSQFRFLMKVVTDYRAPSGKLG